MSLTDARRLWKLLNEAGTAGLHSHDIRSMGVSGNPSQRAKDIADHVPIFTVREPRGKRPGSRYFLAPHAPDYAVPVQPNGADGGVVTSQDESGPGTPVSAVQAGRSGPEGADSEAEPKVIGEKETLATARPRLTLIWDWSGSEFEERYEVTQEEAA